MNSSMNTVFVNTSYTAVPIAEKRQNPEKAIQARLIKQAKRTALENERANTHRFFELDSEARLVNLAHIAALQMKEAPGCETLGDDGVTSPMSLPDDSFSACGDEVVYSAPSVPTEPVSPECSLALVDGSRDMDFEDTFGVLSSASPRTLSKFLIMLLSMLPSSSSTLTLKFTVSARCISKFVTVVVAL
jgi:hypothetical protein